MEWEAPTTDIEGYPLNPDLLTYDISRLEVAIQTGQPIETPLVTGHKGTSAEFKVLDPTTPRPGHASLSVPATPRAKAPVA